jgi:hypothetical protein
MRKTHAQTRIFFRKQLEKKHAILYGRYMQIVVVWRMDISVWKPHTASIFKVGVSVMRMRLGYVDRVQGCCSLKIHDRGRKTEPVPDQ